MGMTLAAEREEAKAVFGAWLKGEREARRLSRVEVARAADISDMQLYRIETGDSGTKREVVRAIAHAIGIDEAETLYRAGYVPSLPYTEMRSERLEPDIDSAALQAFFEGLPRYVQAEEYERIKRLWLEHRRDQTDFGKKAE